MAASSLEHVAATNRFVCVVMRQVICAHCSDSLQRQIAWCERLSSEIILLLQHVVQNQTNMLSDKILSR